MLDFAIRHLKYGLDIKETKTFKKNITKIQKNKNANKNILINKKLILNNTFIEKWFNELV